MQQMKILQIELYKSGRLEKGFNYRYFVPELINCQWQWSDPLLSTLLEKASFSLGELNSFARLVPNKDLYFENLTRVREKNDLLHWLKYFLIGVDETARESSNTLSAILSLRGRLEKTLSNTAGRRTDTALMLLMHLFEQPVIRIKQVEKICGLSTKAANDLVGLFQQHGILKETSGQARYRIFCFEPYLSLFN
ncbi:filamentation induced by cAMP protein fic [Candidatus Magnetobacterium bavaricum]|uniref:Filamentation induced by cAMP protein fic n=1 Tax=Candidatus Magnetobacterium bavaricum TaxID=29290 RepID=A0A0F3H0J0_9BACT|nr:filamentation induced by cAMP protein fic [Candidatus Magnetobacterium bavaricum]